MDDVVKRVARALCAEAGFDYDDENDPMQSSNGDDNGQEYWRSLAETAIRATLEGLERDLALTELSNIEGASADWLDGFRAAIEAHEADKKAFSDAVREALDVPVVAQNVAHILLPFIIPDPEPDPLVEALDKMLRRRTMHPDREVLADEAAFLTAELAARGWKMNIKRIDND